MYTSNINMYHYVVSTIRKLESRKPEQREITCNWEYQVKKIHGALDLNPKIRIAFYGILDILGSPRICADWITMNEVINE